VRLGKLHGDRELPQCQGMLNLTDLASAPSDTLAPFTDRLRLAVTAYLARFEGSSRRCTESDLRTPAVANRILFSSGTGTDLLLR